MLFAVYSLLPWKEIVARLNGEPFSMNLSLVTFDEKEPFELMEILNAVLAIVDTKQQTIRGKIRFPSIVHAAQETVFERHLE